MAPPAVVGLVLSGCLAALGVALGLLILGGVVPSSGRVLAVDRVGGWASLGASCGRCDGLRGCALAAGAVQLRGGCAGLVRRLLRWVGPCVAGRLLAALGAFSRALGLGVGLWAW